MRGIEHKLGINANPTCTLVYGDGGQGAIGYLVGEANRGLEYMFVMMNAARFSVGVQGLAIADRAYQHAVEYAKERIQFRDAASRDPKPVAIIKHPDVRRMLLWCKANIEAMRALAYVTAASLDYAHKSEDEAVRKEHKAFVELMIPIVKGWLTERAIDVCSTALQVFGGMGYVEETGIAQQYRDVRITTIYEGTTGIQALDLVGRKLIRDMGAGATKVLKQIGKFAKELEASDNAEVKALAQPLGDADQGAGRDGAVRRDERDGRPAQGVRELGAVPELLRDRRRRLAAVPRREDRRREAGRRRQRSLLHRQGPNRDVLRAQRALAVCLAAEADRRGFRRRDGR